MQVDLEQNLTANAGPYELFKVRQPGHIEAFAGIWGSIWLARKVSGGPSVTVRKAANYIDTEYGLACSAIREMVVSLQLEKEHNELVPRLLDFFLTQDSHLDPKTLHLVYTHAEHDLLTFADSYCLDRAAVKCLSEQLVAAVDHLHANGVVHRNIKGQTVLVRMPGEKLLLAGMCTAALICPSSLPVDGEENFCCTTISVRAPELLLGPWQYGPAQDMWSCGLLLAYLAGCKDEITKYGFQCSEQWQNTEDKRIGVLLSIFQRLGTPAPRHPLTQLPEWDALYLHKIPNYESKGWNDAGLILGADGVQLLVSLMELDPRLRISVDVALRHSYFGQLCPRARRTQDLAEVHLPTSTSSTSYMKSDVDLDHASEVQPRVSISLLDFMNVDWAAETQLGVNYAAESSDLCTRGAGALAWASLNARAAQVYIANDLAQEQCATMEVRAVGRVFRRFGLTSANLIKYASEFLFERYGRATYIMRDAWDLNRDMRAILIEWLMNVNWKFELTDPVLFFAVDLVDNYVKHTPRLSRKYYQLLGIVSLMVADKVLGVGAITLAEIVYICDKQWAAEEVRAFEYELLPLVVKTWSGWGAFHFLAYYSSQLGLPKQHFHAAHMCLERTLLFTGFTKYTPMVLAGGAIMSADRLLRMTDSSGFWNASSDSARQLSALCRRCVLRLQSVAQQISAAFTYYDFKNSSTYRRFSLDKYSNVANLVHMQN